jgi:huntingtin
VQVVALSDIFTEKGQFEWMLATLLEMHKLHPPEDEQLNQYIVVGLCKAAAVVGTVSHHTHSTIWRQEMIMSSFQ